MPNLQNATKYTQLELFVVMTFKMILYYVNEELLDRFGESCLTERSDKVNVDTFLLLLMLTVGIWSAWP